MTIHDAVLNASRRRSSVRQRRVSTPPSQHLRIILEKAIDLPKSDSEWAGGSSDPYILFEFGSSGRLRSPVVDNSLNPIWQKEEYEFILTDEEVSQHKCLQVSVKDYNNPGMDTLMATLSIDISDWNGATKSDQVVIQPYALNVVAALASQAVKPQLYLGISLLSDEEAKSLVVEEIWENERWLPGKNWSKNHLTNLFLDPPAWCSETESKGGEHFNDAVTTSEGYKSIGAWEYKVGKGDLEGWMYASSFLGPWHNKKAFTSVARRRLWERKLARDVAPQPPSCNSSLEVMDKVTC